MEARPLPAPVGRLRHERAKGNEHRTPDGPEGSARVVWGVQGQGDLAKGSGVLQHPFAATTAMCNKGAPCHGVLLTFATHAPACCLSS